MSFEYSDVIRQLLRTGIDNETSLLLLHVYLSRLIVLLVVRLLTAIPSTSVELTLFIPLNIQFSIKKEAAPTLPSIAKLAQPPFSALSYIFLIPAQTSAAASPAPSSQSSTHSCGISPSAPRSRSGSAPVLHAGHTAAEEFPVPGLSVPAASAT